MSKGLPLITWDLGPFTEINVNNETGLLVPAKDFKALAVVIQTLMNNPKLCIEMGQRGYQRVHKIFTKERMVKETISIYNKVCMSRKN
jgi:glycosyltransferase involved in cell wall biosynthesis